MRKTEFSQSACIIMSGTFGIGNSSYAEQRLAMPT